MGRSKTFTSNYVTKYCAYKMPQKRRRLLASAFRKWFHEEIRPRKFISWADHKFGFRKGEQTFCFDSAGRRVVKTLCQRRMIWFEEFMRTTMTSKKNNRTPRHDKFSANHLSVSLMRFPLDSSWSARKLIFTPPLFGLFPHTCESEWTILQIIQFYQFVHVLISVEETRVVKLMEYFVIDERHRKTKNKKKNVAKWKMAHHTITHRREGGTGVRGRGNSILLMFPLLEADDLYTQTAAAAFASRFIIHIDVW